MTSEQNNVAVEPADRNAVLEEGGWTGLAAELFNLHRAAYPAPWCWEQCGDKCDDPVIGVAWWDDDEDCQAIAGEVVPPPENIDRELYREPIALEMQSHADGAASANAALIVWLRNHVVEILRALARAHNEYQLADAAYAAMRPIIVRETLEQALRDLALTALANEEAGDEWHLGFEHAASRIRTLAEEQS